jgi:hypothetical protein
MDDKNFPPGSSDSSKTILQATTLKGDPGNGGISVIVNSQNIIIPADSDNSNPDFGNNSSEFSIYQGNALVGSPADANGWSMEITSQVNCTASIDSTLKTIVSAITSDTSYYTVRLYKTGYSDLNIVVNVHRLQKGEQGIQGIQGIQGATGATGPIGATGAPGTGLVMKKYTIEVKAPVVPTVTNNGSGFIRLTFPSPHGMELGEILAVSDSTLILQTETAEITSVIDTTKVDIDVAYTASGSADVWSMRHFRHGGSRGNLDYDNADPQKLRFPLIFPEGAKLNEFAIIKIAGATNYPITISAGYGLYPDSGYNSYMSNNSLPAVGNIRQFDLWDKSRSGYNEKFMVGSDLRRNFYMYATTYYGNYNWHEEYLNHVYEIFIPYKYFNTSYTE